MLNNKSLGRGLDTLIPKNFDFNTNSPLQGESVTEIEIESVQPNSKQPRQQFDEITIVELAESIKHNGLIQPIIVTKEADGYVIVAGERRWRASKIAGLKKIPAIVRSFDDLQKLELALVENVQREDLTSIEQAISIQRLHDQFSQSYEVIAKRLGKAKTTIDNMVRLLKLPDYIKEQVLNRTISEGHARCLVSLNNKPEIQEKLYKKIIDENISVRQAEQFVSRNKKETAQQVSGVEQVVHDIVDKIDQIAEKISSKLNLPVANQPLAKGGKLVIKYKDESDLDNILTALNLQNE